MSYKVALIIIYNHQFNKNIDILEDIYKGRFSNIYHLIPFYNGDKSNVIPVYENSYYFQGYVAQAFNSFYKPEYTHYFFVADDMVINPILNENNYYTHLKLSAQTCFLPNYKSFHDSAFWVRTKEAYAYSMNLKGLEVQGQLPEYAEALRKFHEKGLEIEPLKYSQIWGPISSPRNLGRTLFKDREWGRLLSSSILKVKYDLPYPLVGGYSDIFVLSSDMIKDFCHYCGITATTKLFVEIAIPTIMVLTAKEIVTEKELALQGMSLWTEKDYEVLEPFDNDLNKLMCNFPQNFMYLHPIKLSKWK